MGLTHPFRAPGFIVSLVGIKKIELKKRKEGSRNLKKKEKKEGRRNKEKRKKKERKKEFF